MQIIILHFKYYFFGKIVTVIKQKEAIIINYYSTYFHGISFFF